MPVISVRIPQLGEGLQEALLVEFLKKPGESIQRDEPIYVMETDKATTDVESPFAGTLVEWIVEPGTVLAIGSEIGRMEVAEGIKEMPSGHGSSHSVGDNASHSGSTVHEATTDSPGSAVARGDILVPPRTRKYLKDVGLLDHIERIPVRGSKMMPEDVDAYLAGLGTGKEVSIGSELDSGSLRAGETSAEAYQIVPLPKSQVTLNYRMSRGSGACIPVTVVTDIDWSSMEALRPSSSGNTHGIRQNEGAEPASNSNSQSAGPTGFAVACWAVVQAMKQHQKFRSVLSSDGASLKVFSHVNLGVAVALPGDEMVTAVIRQADSLSADDFYRAYSAQVGSARQGIDQADETTTLTVSNIGKAGMRIGIPAVVAPAVATLALGEVFHWPIPDNGSFRFRPTVTATLSFDHRIVNGVGAANFLNDVRRIIERAENIRLDSEIP